MADTRQEIEEITEKYFGFNVLIPTNPPETRIEYMKEAADEIYEAVRAAIPKPPEVERYKVINGMSVLDREATMFDKGKFAHYEATMKALGGK